MTNTHKVNVLNSRKYVYRFFYLIIVIRNLFLMWCMEFDFYRLIENNCLEYK